jgi:hypothetical protein
MTATFVAQFDWLQATTSRHRSMTSRRPLFALSVQHGRLTTSATDSMGNSECLCLQESDVLAVIKTFVLCSAGDPVGLPPQLLKGVTRTTEGCADRRLLALLTDFANLCHPASFSGASLCALNKKKWWYPASCVECNL